MRVDWDSQYMRVPGDKFKDPSVPIGSIWRRKDLVREGLEVVVADTMYFPCSKFKYVPLRVPPWLRSRGEEFNLVDNDTEEWRVEWGKYMSSLPMRQVFVVDRETGELIPPMRLRAFKTNYDRVHD